MRPEESRYMARPRRFEGDHDHRAQGGLKQKQSRKDIPDVLAQSNPFSKFAAMGSLVVLGTLGTPARADELAQNLGPVGPHEPILTEVGSERVIAFYEPDNGRCAVNAVVFDKTDAYTGMTTAARVRVSLDPSSICSYR